MPKDRNSNDAAPDSAAVAEEIPIQVQTIGGGSSSPAVSVSATPAKQKYRNISSTLLTLDDGSHFARKTVAELTPAEVGRFQQAERNSGNAHITPVGGE